MGSSRIALRHVPRITFLPGSTITALYDEMKEPFRKILSSQRSVNALDAVFARPIFHNSAFGRMAGIPRPTAIRLTKALVREGLVTTLSPASGRRSAMIAFEPLLHIVRGQ